MPIKVKNLNHIYDMGMPTEQTALDNISFEVEDGETVGIIGHTGSGKSTLLQHLNGLLKASSGNIIIGDVDITKSGVSMVDIRKRIGLVFQYPEHQLFEETVEKDVAFGPRNLGLGEDEISERVREAVTLVGLDFEKYRYRSPFELSGGQKRAVAIAGVIAMRPEVLILDEPTAGLDPKAHTELLAMIEKVHRMTGNITIIVSHNMHDIARLSDKVIVIDSGKLITVGTPLEVFSKEELLNSVGLDIPPITKLCRSAGIEETILSIDECVDYIAKKIQERK